MHESGGDLFEQFEKMSMEQLSKYSQAFNIFVSDGDKEGILIGYLDLEQEKAERVKVLVDMDFDYWNEDNVDYVRAENRQWVKA